MSMTRAPAHARAPSAGSPGSPGGRGPGRRPRSVYRRRRIFAVVLVALAVFFIWLAVSLGSALTNPALGSSLGARFAEWARDNGGASVVNWIEKEWYLHHQPPKGGKPPTGAIPAPTHASSTLPAGPVHLPVPAAVVPPASPPLVGEGQWHPAGRLVDGVPAVYQAFVRPDAVHTSLVAGIAWMDTKLLKATLYSGSYVPGGGPYTHSAPIQPDAAATLIAAFNAGFRVQDSQAGYYTDGRAVAPLVDGKASFVIYADGRATVAQWGRDASLTPDVAAVRQNLDLIVDNGQPVAGLNANDNIRWGATLGGAVYVWRSGVGVTADGALVYVAGPGLNITTLADLLVRAGAVRAMELDINTDWVNYSTYAPPPGTLASGANGSLLLQTMASTPARYFESWWSRDFFTMSAVPTPTASAKGTHRTTTTGR